MRIEGLQFLRYPRVYPPLSVMLPSAIQLLTPNAYESACENAYENAYGCACGVGDYRGSCGCLWKSTKTRMKIHFHMNRNLSPAAIPPVLTITMTP